MVIIGDAVAGANFERSQPLVKGKTTGAPARADMPHKQTNEVRN